MIGPSADRVIGSSQDFVVAVTSPDGSMARSPDLMFHAPDASGAAEARQ
jgi:hypothetical protein